MTVEIPPIAVCPHCGFESDDEELCRACGKLTDGDIPVRNVSLAHILGSFFSWLQGKGFHEVDHDGVFIKEEPEFDRTWSFLPSNIFHDNGDADLFKDNSISADP